ncbi:MAG TPA: dihydropteroate synthase [Acidimicrobiales bacterium]|nr:dihydropteroate synthase [Acidimicrobiales bacterium]
MLLCLGSRAFDLRSRALVIGVVEASRVERAGALVADGADALVVDRGDGPVVDGGDGLVAAVEVLAAAHEAPVGVASTSAGVAVAAFEAGAAFAEDRLGSAGPDWLAAAAGAGATVVLAVPGAAGAAALDARAAQAEAAGIRPERIALDPGFPFPGAGRAGRPLVLDLGPRPGLATACVGVALGYRVVRTTDVRAARRVADAVAAVLEAR